MKYFNYKQVIFTLIDELEDAGRYTIKVGGEVVGYKNQITGRAIIIYKNERLTRAAIDEFKRVLA